LQQRGFAGFGRYIWTGERWLGRGGAKQRAKQEQRFE
jgi:hypothetical protein